MAKYSYESEQYIGRLFQQAFREFNQRMVARLTEAGYNDLTPSQAEVMSHITGNGISIVEVSQKLGITKQAAGEMVKQLVILDYLSKSVDPNDARSSLVRYGAKGHLFVRDAHAIKDAVEQEYIMELGIQRFEILRDTLVHITS